MLKHFVKAAPLELGGIVESDKLVMEGLGGGRGSGKCGMPGSVWLVYCQHTCGGVCEIGARPTGVVTQELVTSIHASCFLVEHGLGFGNSSLSL